MFLVLYIIFLNNALRNVHCTIDLYITETVQFIDI